MIAQVIKAGLLSSVQDGGRQALALGVPRGGAADKGALRLANALVGNAPGAAALELTLLGPTLHFEAPAVVALCGAPFAATLDEQPLAMWRAVPVLAGATLHLGAAVQGVRALLAVRGGWVGRGVLGSVSAERRAAFGGHLGQGQALAVGDKLCWHPTSQGPAWAPRRAFISPELWPVLGATCTLRVTVTPEGEALPQSVAALLSGTFTVSAQADRMGLRLNEAVAAPRDPARASLPNAPGALQLPPSGEAIVLLPDAGTHGGYPQPLVVIRADLDQLAQLRPGDKLRFVQVSVAQAVEALRRREQQLRQVELALRSGHALS